MYYHYYDYPGWYNVQQQWGVRTEQAKLIVFNNTQTVNDTTTNVLEYEMYDLLHDPNEAHNIYNETEYVDLQTNLTNALADQQALYNDTDFVQDNETPPDVQLYDVELEWL